MSEDEKIRQIESLLWEASRLSWAGEHFAAETVGDQAYALQAEFDGVSW